MINTVYYLKHKTESSDVTLQVILLMTYISHTCGNLINYLMEILDMVCLPCKPIMTLEAGAVCSIQSMRMATIASHIYHLYLYRQ